MWLAAQQLQLLSAGDRQGISAVAVPRQRPLDWQCAQQPGSSLLSCVPARYFSCVCQHQHVSALLIPSTGVRCKNSAEQGSGYAATTQAHTVIPYIVCAHAGPLSIDKEVYSQLLATGQFEQMNLDVDEVRGAGVA